MRKQFLARYSGWTWVNFTLSMLALTLLLTRVADVIQDSVAAVQWPLELDYGEGIVWKQATLIPGPLAYGNEQSLPFIVFHYPPIYYLFARSLTVLQPELLQAGRLVSISMMFATSVIAALLVLLATRYPSGRFDARRTYAAVVICLLMLCLHAVRNWGVFMRVDMLAVALGFLGVLVGALANGRFWGTFLALTICASAVFTKQTELAAGGAVFVVAMLRNPRSTLKAAALVVAMVLGVTAWLQWQTTGGFLQNIVGYNINRYAVKYAIRTFWAERSSLPFMMLMVLAALAVSLDMLRRYSAGSWWHAAAWWRALRPDDQSGTARLMILFYFAISSLMLFTIFKSGGSYNYFLDWLCMGAVLIGIWLFELLNSELRSVKPVIVLSILSAGVFASPPRQLPDRPTQAQLDQHTTLLQRIAAADRPVSSENMSLLMQAGKPILFEPAIVTELAAVGRWNEQPLVDMIREGRFAFMIITSDEIGGLGRRSAAVDAAMRASYPRIEKVAPGLWLRSPPER